MRVFEVFFMSTTTKYQELKGGPQQGGVITKGYNTPVRKNQRNQLYESLKVVMKRHQGMLPYDRYKVLRLLTKKVQEGTL